MNNNDPTKPWNDLFDRLPAETLPNDERREHAKERALAAFDAGITSEKANVPAVTRIKQIGQILMQYRAPYWTAAIILVGFSYLWLGNSPAYALEQIVNSIASCTTARYDAETIINGKTASIGKHFYRAPGASRTEIGSLVFVRKGTTLLQLDSNTKKAQKISVTQIDQPKRAADPGNVFEGFRDILRREDTKAVEVGRKDIEGTKTVGYHIVSSEIEDSSGSGGPDYVVWVDGKTHFPIEIEITIDPPQAEIENAKTILRNYEFDVELDDSLFSMDVPEGYQLASHTKIELGEDTEEAFVANLKKYVSIVGKFPSGVTPISIQKGLFAFPLELGPEQQGDVEALMQDLTKCMLPLVKFGVKVSAAPDSDWQYDGQDAKSGDGTRAVYWYKPDGAEFYRVVYADFSVKEMPTAPSPSSDF